MLTKKSCHKFLCILYTLILIQFLLVVLVCLQLKLQQTFLGVHKKGNYVPGAEGGVFTSFSTLRTSDSPLSASRANRLSCGVIDKPDQSHSSSLQGDGIALDG